MLSWKFKKKTIIKEVVDKVKESSNGEESNQAVKCFENFLKCDQCDYISQKAYKLKT